MGARRGLILAGVLAAAALLVQGQMVTEGAPAPEATQDAGAVPSVESALDAGGDAGAQPVAGTPDGGELDGGSALQTLRNQLAAEQEQVRLLEEQVAAQQESAQRLAQTQAEVQALRQQVADAENRTEQIRQAQINHARELQNNIDQLQQADYAISIGSANVDLSGLSALPPESALYVEAAREALSRSDYLYARYYTELAINLARSGGPVPMATPSGSAGRVPY